MAYKWGEGGGLDRVVSEELTFEVKTEE